MSRLNQNQINAHMSEDTTCQGCDRDQLDCVCCEHDEDEICLSDLDREDDEFYDNYEDDHAAYMQAQWEYESDRFPHDDDYIISI